MNAPRLPPLTLLDHRTSIRAPPLKADITTQLGSAKTSHLISIRLGHCNFSWPPLGGFREPSVYPVVERSRRGNELMSGAGDRAQGLMQPCPNRIPSNTEFISFNTAQGF